MAKTRRNYTAEQKLALVTEIPCRRGPLNGIALELGTSESNYHNWLRAGIRPKKAAPPRPYSPEERERLRASVERLRAEGLSLNAACKTAGISDSSYRKWRDDATPLPLRPDEVTALVPLAASPAPPAPEGLRLGAPSGHRFEGLGVETTAQLLRALP